MAGAFPRRAPTAKPRRESAIQWRRVGDPARREERRAIETGAHTPPAPDPDRRRLVLHVLVVALVSAAFEALFVHQGLSAMDEGWPLHAAMELHDGKTLYDAVFWVFPPGHLLPAWLAYGLDPPGVVLARLFYAAFAVAACVATLFVARRLMPAEYALLAALLVAVAAPRSHFEQLLFGYRYLVWSLVVLLFFHLRLARDESRWLLPAGLFAGVALFFRLTPAFAVAMGVGVGILAASRDWRRWLREGLLFAGGLLLVWGPLLLWFQGTVGLEQLWSEMIVRPVEMTALQSKPLPPILLRDLDRTMLSFAFASIGFRLYWVLYAGLLAWLLYRWGAAALRGERFDAAFLLAFVVFGAIYFTRSIGRSDVPHLDSAIPPIAVLIAWLVSRVERPGTRLFPPGSRAARVGLCAAVFAIWVFLYGSDRYLDRTAMMGDVPLPSLAGEVRVRPRSLGQLVDRLVPVIQRYSAPDDEILVMTHAPLLYVLAERHSPGYFDIVMPGTFRSTAEERGYLERLRARPPAVVVWPQEPFDRNPNRGLDRSAPLLREWVLDHYETRYDDPVFRVMARKDRDSAARSGARSRAAR
jgi:hypothetical protein